MVTLIQDAVSSSKPVRSTSARRRKICHVSMTLDTGGLERLLVEFGKRYDRDTFELSFVALDRLGPPAEELRNLGFEVLSLDIAQSSRARAVATLRRFLHERHVEIVHTHNTYAHFYGTIAARLAGCRHILNTQHGRGCGAGWRDHWQFRIANIVTDKVIGVSEDATRLCQLQDRFAASRMTTIWNGIDVDRFAYRGPTDAPTAISVSRLSSVKDLPTLLRAVAIVVKRYPEFRLRIVGDGPERPHLETLATELGLTEHVEFLGERADVAELLAKAAFFVSSSSTEGISLTILEAMACGLPVVTTRVGGNPEIVDEHRTGLLVSPGAPEELAAAIEEMLQDRAQWPVYGELGRQRVEQNFNVRGMVAQYEALYRDALKI